MRVRVSFKNLNKVKYKNETSFATQEAIQMRFGLRSGIGGEGGIGNGGRETDRQRKTGEESITPRGLNLGQKKDRGRVYNSQRTKPRSKERRGKSL